MRQKKKRIRNNKPVVSENNEVKKLITIVVTLIIVCGLFYLIAVLVNNKDKKSEPTEIQYSKIIVGDLLNQNNEEYYVLAYDPEDTEYESYKSTISGKTDIKYYLLDLTSGFNSKYYTDEQNFDIDSITDISFSETTLLKISNEVISDYYTGNEITEFLQNL